ncbi:hypothetical protein BB561_006324 [Smittium simulii]|uniref:RRM domain-containing protein n=1 Tax=Smittium simulii TaxID=133385 RepID=A0A2T9Y541_9FUNG|nr:hypothetical protein BB561_006324 [Smittium simulii]
MYTINTKLIILTFLSLSKASILNNFLISTANLNVISTALPKTSSISSSSSAEFSLSKRIVNGKSADINEFYFAGSISIDLGGVNYMCTGSLLSQNIVITAASCLKDPTTDNILDPSKILLKFGSKNIINKADDVFKAKKIASHPDYDSISGNNNIALILLESLVSSDNTFPVILYPGNITEKLKFRTAGWGINTKDIPLVEEQKYSSKLKTIEISVTSQKNCEDPSAKNFQSSEGTICSANKNEQGICIGDIGSPLITVDNGSNNLVGIASKIIYKAGSNKDASSNKYSCGKSGDGAIFMRLNHYVDWINENVKNLDGYGISGNQDSRKIDSYNSYNDYSNSNNTNNSNNMPSNGLVSYSEVHNGWSIGIWIQKKILRLLFDDDAIILAESADEFQKSSDTLTEWCKRWGMNINSKKCECKYLEIEFNDQWNNKAFFRAKIIKTFKSYMGCYSILKGNDIPSKFKVMVIKAIIQAVIINGGELFGMCIPVTKTQSITYLLFSQNMNLFEEKDVPVLKQHLKRILEKISDADSEILSEYVIVLLQNEKTERELYDICLIDLKDFLGEETHSFVKRLFSLLKTKEYLSQISNSNSLSSQQNYEHSDDVTRLSKEYAQNSDTDHLHSENYSFDRDYDRGGDFKPDKNSLDFNRRRSKSNSRSRSRSRRRTKSNSRSRSRSNGRTTDRNLQSSRDKESWRYTHENNRYSDNNNLDYSKKQYHNNSFDNLEINIKPESDDIQRNVSITSLGESNDEPYDPEDAVLAKDNSAMAGIDQNSQFNHANILGRLQNFNQANQPLQNFNQVNQPLQNSMVPQNFKPFPGAFGVDPRMGMGMGIGNNINMGINSASSLRPVMPVPYLNPMMRPINPIVGSMPGVSGGLGFNMPHQRPQHFKKNQNYSQNIKNQHNFNESKFNRGSNNQFNKNDMKNYNTETINDEKIGAIVDGQYVIENIPLESLNRPTLESYFGKFGALKSVDIDIDSKSALVVYTNPQDGIKAYRSPDAILGNRFVKIRKRRQQQTEQKVHNELSNETQEIRKNFIAHQKSILEVNERKQKLVNTYMEKQKALMQKLIDPETSSKLSKEATDEIKSSIKKIQALIKEALSIPVPNAPITADTFLQPDMLANEPKLGSNTLLNNIGQEESGNRENITIDENHDWENNHNIGVGNQSSMNVDAEDDSHLYDDPDYQDGMDEDERSWKL